MLAALSMKPSMLLLSANGHTSIPIVDIDGTLIVQFAIFLVLLMLLSKLIFKPYLLLRHERTERIDGAKQDAARSTKQIQEKWTNYEEAIRKARKEAAGMRGGIRSASEKDVSALIFQANEEAKRRQDLAFEQIRGHAKMAQQALQSRTDELAEWVTRKLLGREDQSK